MLYLQQTRKETEITRRFSAKLTHHIHNCDGTDKLGGMTVDLILNKRDIQTHARSGKTRQHLNKPSGGGGLGLDMMPPPRAMYTRTGPVRSGISIHNYLCEK